MSCCGQQRKDASRSGAGPQAKDGAVQLHYLGDRPIAVQGPATGQVYRFDQVGRTRPVAAPDAPAMLRSKLFRRR